MLPSLAWATFKKVINSAKTAIAAYLHAYIYQNHFRHWCKHEQAFA
jgi:hypothetical protein